MLLHLVATKTRLPVSVLQAVVCRSLRFGAVGEDHNVVVITEKTIPITVHIWCLQTCEPQNLSRCYCTRPKHWTNAIPTLSLNHGIKNLVHGNKFFPALYCFLLRVALVHLMLRQYGFRAARLRFRYFHRGSK